MTVKIQVTLEIEYNLDGDQPHEEIPLLQKRLDEVIEEAFENNAFTENLSGYVVNYIKNIKTSVTP